MRYGSGRVRGNGVGMVNVGGKAGFCLRFCSKLSRWILDL